MDLKSLILSAADLKRQAVEVPEWGCTVYISAMTGQQRSRWADGAFGDDGEIVTDGMRARLLVFCLTDENGAPIFSPDDIPALEAKNGAVLNRLFVIAKDANGLGEEKVAAAEKNSPSGGTDTSS